MTIFHTVLFTVAAVAALANCCVELRRCLMMLQQNSYRPERYRKWLSQSADSTSGLRLTGFIVLLFCITPFCPPVAGAVLMIVFLAFCISIQSRRRYKKPLVMTRRAMRIYSTSLAIAVIAAGALSLAGTGWNGGAYRMALVFLAAYCLSHVLVIVATWLLEPLERHINAKYTAQARAILESMPGLRIVGITGSYGKTTTKHYLHAMLSEKYSTLMTPGSFNTPLGVVRTIREQLRPYHEVFIVEMGAKNIGDIDEICRIVHPHDGIITAVGPQHLESFKTLANVQATKFELADSLPADGLVLVNDDFEQIADRPVGNTRCLRYAVRNTAAADYTASGIDYSPAGSTFTLNCPADGWSLRLRTPLVGECNISNVMAAAAMARELGVPDSSIAYAAERLEQVEHRLSIKRVPGGLTIIDDAFNSNPVGSAMALDVLAAMRPGKRILVTPGMIELGSGQKELNEEFGFKAASAADIVIVVGHYNRQAISEGLSRGGMGEGSVYLADSFAHAQTILAGMASAGDTVLYENDLPDTFK